MTLDRHTELRHLSEADVHIADAERQITKQEVILEKLRRDGHDTIEGERLLRGFHDTLDVMRAHRVKILDVLAKIDAGLI